MYGKFHLHENHENQSNVSDIIRNLSLKNLAQNTINSLKTHMILLMEETITFLGGKLPNITTNCTSFEVGKACGSRGRRRSNEVCLEDFEDGSFAPYL